MKINFSDSNMKFGVESGFSDSIWTTNRSWESGYEENVSSSSFIPEIAKIFAEIKFKVCTVWSANCFGMATLD